MKKVILASIALSFAVIANSAVNMTSKFDVNFYGFIKTAAQHTSGSTASNEYSAWVNSASSKNQQFRLTAKETRFGFDIKAGEHITGKIEMDFYGLGESVVTGNSGTTLDLRIRHAFININHGQWDFLFGQFWHLTPLILPSTNNAFCMGYSGALWMRVPQMRATYTFNNVWQAAFAFTRATTRLTDSPGTNEGRPGIEGTVIAKVNGAKLALSGAFSRWRNPANLDQHGDVYLVDLGYSVPLSSIFTVKGQIWTGQNLADFLGGVGNVSYGETGVRASGGYVNLTIKPWQKVWFNTVFGIDDPLDRDVAVGGRVQNLRAFANVYWKVYDLVTMAFEAGPMQTIYKTANGIDKRGIMMYEFSAKFPF